MTYEIRRLDASTWDLFAELVERNDSAGNGYVIIQAGNSVMIFAPPPLD